MARARELDAGGEGSFSFILPDSMSENRTFRDLRIRWFLGRRRPRLDNLREQTRAWRNPGAGRRIGKAADRKPRSRKWQKPDPITLHTPSA